MNSRIFGYLLEPKYYCALEHSVAGYKSTCNSAVVGCERKGFFVGAARILLESKYFIVGDDFTELVPLLVL